MSAVHELPSSSLRIADLISTSQRSTEIAIQMANQSGRAQLGHIVREMANQGLLPTLPQETSQEEGKKPEGYLGISNEEGHAIIATGSGKLLRVPLGLDGISYGWEQATDIPLTTGSEYLDKGFSLLRERVPDNAIVQPERFGRPPAGVIAPEAATH